MAIDSKTQAGLALAATTLLAGVAAGIYALRVHDTITLEDGTTCATHLSIDWQETPLPGAVCKVSEIVGPSDAWAALGLCPDGRYAIARICGVPADGAGAVSLPAGISVTSDPTDEAAPYVDGPQLEVWDMRHSAAKDHLRCACSPGADCEWLASDEPGGPETWGPAPKALTLYPGRWRGTGCVKKLCFESFSRRYAGDSMPEACR